MTNGEEFREARIRSLLWLLVVVVSLIIMIIVSIATVRQGEELTGRDRQGVDVPYH